MKAFKAHDKNLRILNFRFIVLEIGPEWKSKEKRLKKEQEYIQMNKTNCYNSLSEKPVFIKTIRLFLLIIKNIPVFMQLLVEKKSLEAL